jgi:hypothetical protein
MLAHTCACASASADAAELFWAVATADASAQKTVCTDVDQVGHMFEMIVLPA